MTHRLGILQTHPIQYLAPLFRRLADHPDVELRVFFCSRQGLESYQDEGFGGVEIQWDIPLLDGYDYQFLEPVGEDNGLDGFFSLINPDIVRQLSASSLDALQIHGHNFAVNHLATLAGKLTGTSMIMRCDTHASLSRTPFKQRVRNYLMKRYYRLLDAFLAIGTLNKHYYQTHGVAEQKIFTAPYSVNNEFFASRALSDDEVPVFMRQEGLDPERPVVLYVGKLQRRKRVRDLLEAFARLDTPSDPQLVVVGDGDEMSSLQKRATRLNIDTSTSFMGFRNQSELPKWYSVGDVFVLPSEDEPWALVVNEAMNAGTPVIGSTDAGATHDLIIEGETGFRFSPGDISTLSDRIKMMVTNPDRCEQMGEASRRRVDQWGLQETVSGFIDALDYLAD